MARPKSEDKKQALLEAATVAFAQSGIAASTSAIARSAGVAEGTLFRYFATKDELLNELYLAIKLRLVRTMIAGLDPDEKRPKENARNIWNSYIDWGVRNPMEHKAIRRMALSERITARDLRSVFWRSFTLQGSWNYERQQHMGYAFAMSPALKRIYQDPTELGRALQRHLVLFNTTPHLSTFIFGLSIAMEEENQRNPEFNEESINAIKTSLMGPLAGIGDSIFWGSLKVIAAGMGIYFAQQGSLLGPILALLVYNLPHLLCRWYGLKLGYRAGTTWLMRIYQSGLMDRVTYIASIVGLMVVGAMTASMIDITTPLSFTAGQTTMKAQEFIDKILPSLLPLLFTLGMYKLIRKGVNINWILLGTVAFGMAASALGLL